MYPFLRINSLVIPTFLIFIVLGFTVAGVLLRKQFLESTINRKWLWIPIVLVSIITAYVGTTIDNLFSMVFPDANETAHSFHHVIGWFGGFTFSSLTIITLLKIFRLSVRQISDLAAPCIAIGQVFGRIGCFLAGDGCYGRATDLPWGMAFPDGVVPITIKVHPTPIYEAVLLLLIFIFLWRVRHIGLPAGTSIALYLILTGIERFFVEFIRLNAKFMFNLTGPQIFSLLFIVIGSTMLYNRRTEIYATLFLQFNAPRIAPLP
jgi:phosphatidylglycerol---prolipoprotein diacylglyceryl transferase